MDWSFLPAFTQSFLFFILQLLSFSKRFFFSLPFPLLGALRLPALRAMGRTVLPPLLFHHNECIHFLSPALWILMMSGMKYMWFLWLCTIIISDFYFFIFSSFLPVPCWQTVLVSSGVWTMASIWATKMVHHRALSRTLLADFEIAIIYLIWINKILFNSQALGTTLARRWSVELSRWGLWASVKLTRMPWGVHHIDISIIYPKCIWT